MAHHDDYSQPLRIAWLCSKHHIRRHRELGWGLPDKPFVNRSRGGVSKGFVAFPDTQKILAFLRQRFGSVASIIIRRGVKLVAFEMAKNMPGSGVATMLRRNKIKL